MRDVEANRDVARFGDHTDHGGKVIEAATTLKHMGFAVVLDGHLTMCPKCNGGTFPIIASGARTHGGRKVAFIGDKTACGGMLIRV